MSYHSTCSEMLSALLALMGWVGSHYHPAPTYSYRAMEFIEVKAQQFSNEAERVTIVVYLNDGKDEELSGWSRNNHRIYIRQLSELISPDYSLLW